MDESVLLSACSNSAPPSPSLMVLEVTMLSWSLETAHQQPGEEAGPQGGGDG